MKPNKALRVVLGLFQLFKTGQCSLNTNQPVLRLPYGTWIASSYDVESDLHTFRNVRYAAAPVGSLRFVRPQPPKLVYGIQNGSVGADCTTSEDCLFLDVQVPSKAIKKHRASTPVIVYIHGGGYMGGSKDDVDFTTGLRVYNAGGIALKTRGDAILVTLNYRLGALGWLNGKAAKDVKATNLGLHDQRAALQWVQDYIHLLGGNKSDVTIWGMSAGGGSIMHHMTQYGGTQNPLFSKVFVQSPGFFPDWNRTAIDAGLQAFLSRLNCGAEILPCLQKADLSAIRNASELLKTIGPAEDGDFVRKLPILAFGQGEFWRKLDSVISSHVLWETLPTFKEDGSDITTTELMAVLLGIFGNLSTVKQIAEHYPPPEQLRSPFNSNAARLASIQNDLIFVSNAISTAVAYRGRSFSAVYSVSNATHSADTRAPFYNPSQVNLPAPQAHIMEGYQAYILDQVLSDKIQKLKGLNGTIDWPMFDGASFLNVTDDGFKRTSRQDSVINAKFWEKTLSLLSTY